MKELRTAAEVLERLSHNLDALRAAVEELTKWVGDRGAATSMEPLPPWTTISMPRAKA